MFLDEFVGDLDLTGDLTVDATVGLKRAEDLYERVFFEYGDDSVAQLGGVHLACEQASNLLTKVLEWGRLMAYLEQSTRYIPYDSRLQGRYRYLRPSHVCASPMGTRYVSDLDALFDIYSASLPAMMEWAREQYPKQPTDSDFVYKQTIKAKACDTLRGLLPAATLSNVGIYGTGQAFEALLLRMRPSAARGPDVRPADARRAPQGHPVVPRARRPPRARGSVVVVPGRDARRHARARPAPVRRRATGADQRGQPRRLGSRRRGQGLAAICYPHTRLPEAQLLERVRALPADDRVALVRAYVGERTNRRHKPGRAFERTAYRFDVLGDYGAFRDLQRHRMLTIEWQQLTPHHGYEMPAPVSDAGLAQRYDEAMERSAGLYAALVEPFPDQAAYAVSLGYRMRYVMHMNAREAMHLCELRSSPQGHPTYRRVAQEMHRQIAERAGHRAIAEAMRFVDHGTYDLERLDAERAAEMRRALPT